MTRAVDEISDNHPDFPTCLGNLGVTYRDRFLRLEKLDDIEQAIAHLSRTVALIAKGHEDLALWLNNLGLCYSDCFERIGTLDDLVKTIEYQAQAVNTTPEDHPYLPTRLGNLGTSYTAQFLRLDGLDDLERAISHLSRAVLSTPEDHADLPLWLNNLGLCYSNRFDRVGMLDDLVKAIEYQTQAVNTTPEGHPELPAYLVNLGMYYHDRFLRLGELSDIQQAIAQLTRALALIPEDHAKLPLLLNNLGLCYSNRFEREEKHDDLIDSIKYQTQAVDLTPEGHPDLPMRLSNLGASYRARFLRSDGLDDLEQAITHISRAVTLTPEDHTDLPLWLNNLGTCYSDQFDRVGTLEILENAITHLSHALNLTPDEHPSLTRLYRNLASTSLSQYLRTSDPSHLQDALEYFRRGSELATGPPRARFECAFQWAEEASKHDALKPMEAYLSTMELLPQFIWLGVSTSQRYNDLTTTENLAINAAEAAILCSDYALALEWLEHARCVVWSQSLMLHSPLDHLHSSHPVLAARLQVIAQQLHEVSSDAPAAQAHISESHHAEQVGRQRRSLATEYESLLAEARTLPGFEDFLRPMKAKDLLQAARNGPIVVINCHERCCDALIIIPGQDAVKHLSLLEYNRQKAQGARFALEGSLREKGLRQRGVKPLREDGFASMLPGLWRYVVKPILDHLGFTNDVPIEKLPHITWCPTGPMSFLPLHAAGDYDQPRSCVFDYAVSSYTPTLSALLASSPSTLTRTSGLLAIGQANTPGHNPLPGTTGELECVKSHTQNKVKYAQLTGSQATIETVLGAMDQHDWVHIACHAFQNIKSPTESGFFLHDGTLELTAINRSLFKNKGLAFLSACQTATDDETLPDEAIHLASGMLMAGYSSVIATMWSIVDSDAPFVADKVYAELMKEGKVGNGEAGRALHYAVASLREKVGVKEFGRWVPYIHIGS